jgi:hypothetical protein
MPRAQGATSVAAGATNNNVLSGENVQFVERPSRVTLLGTAEAAGESRFQFKIGAREVLAESPVSRQARHPIKPDDVILSDIGMPGEQLTLKIRNTGAGANVAFWAVEVDPIA